MPRGGHAAKVDENQPAIVALLRFCGWEVALLSPVGGGIPDLLIAVGTVNVLMEVKMPGKKLNEAQRRWHRMWTGDKYVVETAEQAVRLCVLIERHAAGELSRIRQETVRANG